MRTTQNIPTIKFPVFGMPHQDLIPFQWGAPGTFIGILSGKGQNAGVSSITDCKSDSDAIGSWIVAKEAKANTPAAYIAEKPNDWHYGAPLLEGSH
tara:strand:- start:440 stop:727 length:288 start_codon:yes stop_codon:yes gene_type:complete